jgi:hypothetical protein
MSRRILMVSPHYPPDATAGAHRVRVLAPHLPAAGWEPTILTVDPQDYEGVLDGELAERMPPWLEVVRVRAWPAARTRGVGVGDLGLRAFAGLRRTARRLLGRRSFAALYITTYPIYPAAIGPGLARAFGVPFVLDLQDPWVGAWGETVGPGPGGAPDVRSRLSRAVAVRLERRVVPRASALTGVSSGLLDELAVRYPVLSDRPRLHLPVGFDPGDLDWIDRHPKRPPAPCADGALQICYVGTLLPLGVPTVRAVFAALSQLPDGDPRQCRRLCLRFVGTSNQARADAQPRALAWAAEAGVGAMVSEEPMRLPFLDALRIVRGAGALLLAGTTEARYTASKLDVALASGRPILAIFHEQSDVARRLRPIASRDSSVRLITYADGPSIPGTVSAIRSVLDEWRRTPPVPRIVADDGEYLAPALARQMASMLDSLVPAHA